MPSGRRGISTGSAALIAASGERATSRGILHVADLFDLVSLQIDRVDRHSGRVYNVGGGPGCSVFAGGADRVVRRTQSRLTLGSDPVTRAADIPYYVTDTASVTEATGWSPSRAIVDPRRSFGMARPASSRTRTVARMMLLPELRIRIGSG